MSSTYKLECASDPADFARRAAETMATAIDLALDQRARAQIALSGGSTPGPAYSLLAQQHLPWDRVDVLLGDERWVSADDEASNARLLRSTLLAPGTPVPMPVFTLRRPLRLGAPRPVPMPLNR